MSSDIAERSKEKRSELKHKLKSMEERAESPEVNISVMPNLQTEIPRAAQDEQPPLEQFEEMTAGV